MSEQLPPVSPVAPAPAPASGKKGLATASLVLGIVDLCLIWIPFINYLGILASVVGLILGILGLKTPGKKMAVAGIVLAAIAIVMVIVNAFIIGPMIGNIFNNIISGLGQ